MRASERAQFGLPLPNARGSGENRCGSRGPLETGQRYSESLAVDCVVVATGSNYSLVELKLWPELRRQPFNNF
jgi:hypothetical protein